ncbi:MAG: uracil-DNA glycosylase [Pseudomonadota bacterium]
MLTAPEPPKDCRQCKRLVAYRETLGTKHPDWFNGAVPSFGDPKAQLLILGLAPGASGANRTGRVFTGDQSGLLLFEMLGSLGVLNGAFDNRADDGLRLDRAMITNAVRCVPPENRPIAAEIRNCSPFLRAQIEALAELKLVLCLGKIAHDAAVRTFGLRPAAFKFGHCAEFRLPNGQILLSSYHCSRYNLNTGRLTRDMFQAVFLRAAQVLQD